MRLFILLILIAFPIAEIYLLIQLADRYGWWLLLYLVVITYLGLQLIKDEKQMMSAKMMQSMQAGGNPFKTVMGSARNLIAGFLLIIPGVITDVIAAILLLIPIQQPKVDATAGSYQTGGSETNGAGFEGNYRKANTRPANDDIIEGEYEEIKDPVSDENVISVDKDTEK
jgi:UPF0716 protein FxsA